MYHRVSGQVSDMFRVQDKLDQMVSDQKLDDGPESKRDVLSANFR